MRALVTGANGYIGRHVVQALLDRKAEVVACDLATDGIPCGAEKVTLNIFDHDINVFWETGKPEIVVHMAWKDGFVHNSSAHMEHLSDHVKFCNRIVDSGIKTLAVMGSMHEVGYWEGVINENTPCNPISQYGVAKNALRQSLIISLANKVNFQWLRAYYIYGDDNKASSIFAKITAAEELGDKMFPFTSGKNKYDFITIGGLAQQIAACVMQDKVNGIINCCTGKPLSLADKMESYIVERKFKIKLNYGAFPDRPYDSPAIWGDSSKIEKIMNNEKNNLINVKAEFTI